jgi:uncharacterized small protein (DUF1192 family)
MIDPNASDWSDLDLLTIEEAEKRIHAEITVMQQEIERLQADDSNGNCNAAALAAAQRRLEALRRRRGLPSI